MAESKSMEQYLVPLETPCVYYDKTFLPVEESISAYTHLRNNIHWEKTAKINRWVCLTHEQLEKDYKYRDAPGESVLGMDDTVRVLRQRCEAWYAKHTGRTVQFNVCLLNYYEDGQQRIGWHSDREEIGRDTPIASISLGTRRTFALRSKENGVTDRATLSLEPGSLVVMENVCQHKYVHSIPKDEDVTEGRINLTFRCKSHDTAGEGEHERRDNWMNNMIEDAAPTSQQWSAQENTIDNGLVFGDGVLTHDCPGPIRFLVKTNMGTEGYCAAELMELIPGTWTVVARPQGMDGYVACIGDEATEVDVKSVLLQNCKSAHHVLAYHAHFDLAEIEEDPVDGEALYQYFKNKLVNGDFSVSSLATADSFRVTCERIGGPHAFRGPEVEREIGGALSEFYTNCVPSMNDYDVNVRADVVGVVVVVGTQLNVVDLSKDRHFLKFRNVVTIKTNLAYAMIRCAAISPGSRIADPFCGSGTLLLEALEHYEKTITCVGLDVSRRSIEGARENAIAETYDVTLCEWICSDARALRRHLSDESVDAMVTNLPWGVMTGQKADLQTTYEIFLRNAWYKLLRVNVVRTTNNLPCIVVVEKLSVDELRESVKGQLAHLNKYVSVSPEMYQAIHMEDINGN